MKISPFEYTANYCEENIWHLCQHPFLEADHKKVVLISNTAKNCPFYAQKSALQTQPVWWDYHVVLLATIDSVDHIYDFDSDLPFPTPLTHYLNQTFPNSESWLSKDLPQFKIIPAVSYINDFNSDRSHMKDSFGKWIFTPPAWPLIGTAGKLLLRDLLDFDGDRYYKRFTLNQMHLYINSQ
ncbi:protein N-terminal glutamine amidohydrolase [Anditalea andensis]|uniref:Protein N-terminal glutamine amidohydrolase n=1 Tax=Anditalea andensis TaxID=1048983 RepID=A0A074L7D1_9BACT|nr:hypothetical protein [Anditalea andensis]KEO75758.1 hypothetical protein EL17_22290 [Anditalea andensis]